ncbi:MAG TPA: alcohol dehydrogenase catalytic domain-containing protein [Spirochaetales bacterium]|nr:alcohol dehydrogenase catalytic domain-containing protein [Spirochaetales bacterium]HRY55597.1 alcohol dehydrogenase catalytic domain-containing protein [Spirochaetia bacterium]HRZ63867.1 alcohol dehydrogenase catalytic domain-containing protein [Spirochaetia bacterium]
MRAAVLTAPGKLEIRELPLPRPERDELLVKLKACGICTLEQRLYRGAMQMPLPLVPGHEAAGEVVEVGPAVVGSYVPGTRVALDLVTRCGECYYCRIGKSNLCSNRFKPGQRVLGGFAEYLAVRPSQAYPLPPGLGFDEAAFTEPLSCCVHSLKKLKLAMTEDLLVVGAGVMGLLHLLVARCMGLRTTVSDPDPSRLEAARRLGADFAVDPAGSDLGAFALDITEGLGYSACVVTSPAPEAFASAAAALAKCARVNIFTSYESAMALPLDANEIHRRELTVTGTEGRLEEDFFQALRLLAFEKVDVRPLISARTSFSTIAAGFEEALSGRSYRVLLEHEAP